jgi:DNA repair exonuclease SbcCD nuclease subunit
MKIMVLGDTHGNTRWLMNKVTVANDHDADRILQCGDFGIWDHTEEGVRFLDTVNHRCRETGVKVYFIPGNHENYDRLDWYARENPREHDKFVYIRSHILYIPRGTSWQWGKTRFVGVGGAVSIDKEYRTFGESWWPQEQLTDDEVDSLRNRRIYGDVLVTHDSPSIAPFGHRTKNDIDSQIHRMRMNEVGKIVRPKFWFHGHYHTWMPDYTFRHDYGTARVFGLNCDGFNNTSIYFDTELQKIVED